MTRGQNEECIHKPPAQNPTISLKFSERVLEITDFWKIKNMKILWKQIGSANGLMEKHWRENST
jgi:hypothetical protein